MTDLLLGTPLDEVQRDYAETVEKSAEALLTIVNDILDYSKIEAGKLSLEAIGFDLHQTIDDLNDVLSVRPQQKGLEYLSYIDPAVPTSLEGDPGRLRQVLTNLIGNAVKFTEAGEIRLSISVDVEDDDSVRLLFSVEDTGIGVPESAVSSLFAPFTQVDASTTRRYGGTGLGLSICKRLVDAMGGTIGVESTLGKGSKFSFTASFRKRSGVTGTKPASVESLDGVRILVIDDSETNRKLLVAQTTAWGCRASSTPGAEAGIAELEQAVADDDPYRLAIVDMQMPDVDGAGFGSMVSALPAISGTLLVMMTSLDNYDDARSLAEIGFAAFLTKPVKPARLREVLLRVLDSEREGRSTLAGTGDRRVTTAGGAPAGSRSTARVLVAEDNVTNQKVAHAMLTKLGCTVHVVSNGGEAIETLRTAPCDLVFMDVQMPHMDGIEATRLIRDPSTGLPNPRIPVIAMTARAMKGDREMLIAVGMDDYLSKPIDREELERILERYARAADRSGPQEPVSLSSVPRGGELPVLETEVLMEMIDGDDELYRSILDEFIANLREQLVTVRCAVEIGDGETAQRTAHLIKGAAANVGARRLAWAAAALEMAAKDSTATEAPARELEAMVAELIEHHGREETT
jgi:CheY-like chemotaxis protein/HPt (histidine-containing phosphotransfer) domain-containing protein